MAPFEGLASIFRGSSKASNSAPPRTEEWLRENAVAVVHLAAISLATNGATFTFDALLRAAQKISCDIPLTRDRVFAVLNEADVERLETDRFKLVA